LVAKRGRRKPTAFSLSEEGCLVSLMRDLNSGWDLSLKRRKMHRNRRKISRSKQRRWKTSWVGIQKHMSSSCNTTSLALKSNLFSTGVEMTVIPLG